VKNLLMLTLLFSSVAGAADVQVYSRLSKTHGNTGQMLSEPVSIQVLNTHDNSPATGVPVNFAIQTGDAQLHPHRGFLTVMQEGLSGFVVYTDSTGMAMMDLEFGSNMGEVLLTAVAGDSLGELSRASIALVSINMFTLLFHVLGGLAIFLMGLHMMSGNLQQVAGSRLKGILKRITSNRFMGVATGALITAAIQSSSATAVITVGFVNSSLMTLQQAVGVILGANIGTTITGQLIAFKITSYAFPIIAVGFALSFFGKHKTQKLWGKALMGLGLLIFGMGIMNDVMKPLRASAPVRDFFADFSTNPLLAVFAGTFVTVIVQSSSATVGLTIALAGAGLVNLQGAVFLVLGDNIGTTITAQLAAIGSNRAARQTAMAHTFFNLIGAAYFMLFALKENGLFLQLVRLTSSEPMRQVANAHSIFNIVNCIIFIPLIPMLTRLCRLVIPDREKLAGEQPEIVLDINLLESPILAIDNLNREMAKMADYSGKCIVMASEHFLTGRHEAAEINRMEAVVDAMQRDMTDYAAKLFQGELTWKQSRALPVIIHTINDLERISDHAVKIIGARDRVARNVMKEKGPLPALAVATLETLGEMAFDVVKALRDQDLEAAQRVLVLEGRMNGISEEAREKYGEALASRMANMTGLAVLDYILYCERSADHFTNIAQSLIGGGVWHGRDSDR
jgi:phosphate:Na+ symporter